VADDKAKEVYGQFLKSIKANDFEGMMKIVDVPWLDTTLPIIRDEKVLRKQFKELLDDDKELAKVKFSLDVKEILSYDRFRKRFKEDDDNREFLKLLDEMKLTHEDRVIVETFTAFLIRIRNGKARIVGALE
jgi:hypothetical protein